MMLDNYVRDFKALIDWIQLQEKLEKTDAQNRWSFLQLCAILLNFFFMYTNFVELLTPKFNFLNVNRLYWKKILILSFRPTSLAWEVRKMSPGRHVMPNPSADRMVTSPGARRALNFR